MNALGSPKVVAQWPCRYCRTPTDLTEAGAEAYATFSARLRATGKAPLRTDEVLVCSRCRRRWQSDLDAQEAARKAEVEHLLVELGIARSADEERAIWIQLKSLGASDAEISAAVKKS